MRAFLVDQWLPSLHDLRPNTRLSYETLARLHVLPHLGDRQLQKLRRSDCDGLYNRLQQPDPVSGRSLSSATVRRIHALLHSCLNVAVQHNLAPTNVSDRELLAIHSGCRAASDLVVIRDGDMT